MEFLSSNKKIVAYNILIQIEEAIVKIQHKTAEIHISTKSF